MSIVVDVGVLPSGRTGRVLSRVIRGVRDDAAPLAMEGRLCEVEQAEVLHLAGAEHPALCVYGTHA